MRKKETNKNTATEKIPYKTAFFCLLALFFCSLTFFLFDRWITYRSAEKIEYYEEILAETTERGLIPETTKKVNINTAGLYELMELPGIGKSKAQNILDYREQYGKILDMEDVLKINGIGEGIAAELEPYLIFEEEQTESP